MVVPIDTLPRGLATATTYPIRGVVQVAYLSLVLCLTAPLHLIRVSWTGHIRKWRLSIVDLSSERRKTVEERGGGDSRREYFCVAVCGKSWAFRKRRCRHDGNPSLQLRLCGQQSRHRRLLRAVSLRKKKSHAESSRISHPSAPRSSEPRLQMFSTKLDAIEDTCLFCVMCLVPVGRVIRTAEDGDSVMQHS